VLRKRKQSIVSSWFYKILHGDREIKNIIQVVYFPPESVRPSDKNGVPVKPGTAYDYIKIFLFVNCMFLFIFVTLDNSTYTWEIRMLLFGI
jgi:hypothetical protein